MNKLKQMNVQLAMYLILISVFAVVILSVFVFSNISSLLEEDANLQTKEDVNQSAGYIEGYLEKVKGVSDIIAMHPDTIQFIEGKSTSERAVKALMDLAKGNDERILNITLVVRNGDIITSGESELEITMGDMMEENWYMEAKDSHQMPALTSLRRTELTMEKETWVVSVSREIVNESNEHLGVLLIDIDYNFFEKYLESIPFGQSGYAFIIDIDGQVVYHPDVSYFEDERKKESLVEICELGEGSENEGLVTFKTNIGHSKWILVGLSSLDNVERLQKELIKSVFIVGMIVLVVSFLMSIIVSKKLTSPIKTLQRSMITVSENWEPVQIRNSFYEVENLSRQYNKMITQIKTLLNTIKENEKKMRDFEFRALQNQINPHFLYNTLDTIVWLSEFKETEKVIDVTKALSSLLRVSLKNDKLVSLEEELNHVSNYLAIQKERYAEALEYEVICDIDKQFYRVPKLILQPIVENSIYHGIKEGSGSGKVIVEVKLENDLIIIVSDNGRGYDTDEKKDSNTIGGVGIKNVDQRIKLICGPQYGLEIKSKVGQGTIVTYRLPVN